MSELLERLRTRQDGTLPGYLGLEWTDARPGAMEGRLEIASNHLAPNGYLHAATVIALADTACGYGCIVSLPEGARGFTTAELKANFIGTLRAGTIACKATLRHGGRTTQIWDAEVTAAETGKTIALFRCTQILLYDGATGGN